MAFTRFLDTGLGDRVRCCQICKAYVKGFDHHCPAFGNCIGDCSAGHKNYLLFMVLLTGFLWTEATYLVCLSQYGSQFEVHDDVTRLEISLSRKVASSTMVFSILQLVRQRPPFLIEEGLSWRSEAATKISIDFASVRFKQRKEMGQWLSCSASHENIGLFSAVVQSGDLEMVQVMLKNEPSLLHNTTLYDRQSPLHIAAANGQMEILSLLLERSVNPDLLNRHKQTPLMLAAMHGKISCLRKLLEVGANILKFDSLHGRTCLHYAAYHGHFDCLEAILSAAQSSPVAASWGFVRFVNIRDGKGATPLHLAARQTRPECIHILLDNGALASASTHGYGCGGSTPLHLAARGGSLDCIRELLAWGADRLQRDSSGRIPYVIAMKHRHGSCAALLNPSSTEPLVWPSPLKFINELNQEAKALLEQALMEANREREKSILKTTSHALSSPSHSDTVDHNLSEISDIGDGEVCSICFVQASTIEVQNCGHVMCAQCTLSLCCHSKPNPTTACLTPPVCPFCRSNIVGLVVVETKTREEVDDHETNSSKQRKGRKSLNFSDGGSSSFKGLSSMIAFGKTGGGRSSGRIAAEEDD